MSSSGLPGPHSNDIVLQLLDLHLPFLLVVLEFILCQSCDIHLLDLLLSSILVVVLVLLVDKIFKCL